MKTTLPSTYSPRMIAATQLTVAWTQGRKRAPSVDAMLDAFESFYEQLEITESNEKRTLLRAPAGGKH